ncbi:type II 3-dehydroquinate dehydratase [Aestuariibacter halophilus]|uniref:3-dehydroquinate dehydratase n=1 Tax=Fluctibacter halophilus TaxID=226011 RepID=A0ABS8G983_9ALTE|nr:type II 3-dehydroquinate dehydratase [Aestuariibacter halophilus]MCC2617095.1 type II 3-dehydroquinate dehydratase [Aestuariibacter halophilus]
MVNDGVFLEDGDNIVKVLLLNGPNLNMLGKREPHLYGDRTLSDIVADLQQTAAQQGIELIHQQSNAEHVLIDTIHQAMGDVDVIIINPGAFTHTSVALRDALLSVSIPFIEVHLSNVHAREPFRQHSYLSDIAKGVICGFGEQGYRFALQAAEQLHASS